MKTLIISNGHGEDLVGAKLAEKLSDVVALPIVGEGKAYNCKVLGPRKKLPSGGFSLRNLSYLLKDLRSGLFGSFIEQIKIVRSGNWDLIIAIGDIVPMFLAKISKTPFIFLGVNKTYYYKWFGYSYTPWEIWLLKSAKKVYTRDQLTADTLVKKGIKAEYIGNPLMDTLVKHQTSNIKHQKIIGLLPGTREGDIQKNLEDFNKIKIEINRIDPSIEFIVARKENFEEVLSKAALVIGLSGTGNEQAAGMGIPVVSFPGRGSQYTKKFGEAQAQLLGKALAFIPERDFKKISEKCLKIISDPNLLEDMGKSGREQMQGGDSIEKIAEFTLKHE